MQYILLYLNLDNKAHFFKANKIMIQEVLLCEINLLK